MSRVIKIKPAIIIIACVFLLIGCSQQLENTYPAQIPSNIQDQPTQQLLKPGACASSNGRFLFQDELLCYLDFDTMQKSVICKQENCSHNSLQKDKQSNCPAALDEKTFLFYFNNRLYTLSSSKNERNKIQLFTLNSSKSSWNLIGEYPYQLNPGQIILDQGIIYCSSVKKPDVKNELQVKSEFSIFTINLGTGEHKTILLERTIYLNNVTFYGIYNQNIYYCLTEQPPQQAPNYQYEKLNTTSQEVIPFLENKATAYCQMSGNFIFYSHSVQNCISVINLDSMETKDIPETGQAISTQKNGRYQKFASMQMMDGKLFFYTNEFDQTGQAVGIWNHLYYYDPVSNCMLESGVANSIYEKTSNGVELLYETNSYFIIRSVEKNGAFLTSKIVKSDFYQGIAKTHKVSVLKK